MKTLSIACSLLLAAAMLQAADEPKKSDPKPEAKPAVADSPLVAASKKSHRKNAKPATVITNDMLLKSGGHITTTQKSADLPEPPKAAAPKPETDAEVMEKAKAIGRKQQEAKAKAAAEKKKKDAKEKFDRAAETYTGGDSDDRFEDPAAAEHAMSENAKAAGQDQPQDKKPPQP